MIVHAHIYMSGPKNSIMRPSKTIGPGPILETAESLKDQKKAILDRTSDSINEGSYRANDSVRQMFCGRVDLVGLPFIPLGVIYQLGNGR